MERVFPDYYQNFRCIADACRHNCCIGWEIDIDPDTLAFYDTLPGALGERLKRNIARGGEPHFILGEGERCPFLNDKYLCDLIIELGEESICGICTEHPRFHNALPGRVESGIGFCCEAAGRLILGRSEPVRLIVTGEAEGPDEIVALRDEALVLLQDREKSIPARIEALLALCGGSLGQRSMGEWAEQFLALERLDEAWTKRLKQLRDGWQSADLAGFDRHMAERESEYEQLLVYFVYRHLSNAVDEADMAARSAFAALGYTVLHTMGALLWQEKGVFSFDDQVELARLFSSEIEYSDENLDILLDELC